MQDKKHDKTILIVTVGKQNFRTTEYNTLI